MSSVHQSSFLTFHQTIKLGNTDENKTLREKRDLILERLRNHGLKFSWFNQGSYAMTTGVRPLDLDYDIDVGLVFTGERPQDPLAAKAMVFNAAFGHTQKVEWRRHCVRVQYTRQGTEAFHVDLAVYWQVEGFFGPHLYLAVGKQHSSGENKEWREASPKALVSTINGHFTGEDHWQFTRVVRYLKRWKDFQFPTTGQAAPRGIALTLAAYKEFSPKKAWNSSTSADYDDLAALQNVVSRTVSNFGWGNRISLTMPGAPQHDVCAKMTDQQMTEFKGRLQILDQALKNAAATGLRAPLLQVFGSDFPR